MLTNCDVDDSKTLSSLLEQLQTPIQRFIGDGSYDCRPVYRAVGKAGADDVVVVIPPIRGASIASEPKIRTWKQRNQAVGRMVFITLASLFFAQLALCQFPAKPLGALLNEPYGPDGDYGLCCI